MSTVERGLDVLGTRLGSGRGARGSAVWQRGVRDPLGFVCNSCHMQHLVHVEDILPQQVLVASWRGGPSRKPRR